jgi:flagellar motor protein MotB
MDRPVSKNDSQAGRQQNRRVEIIIENPSRSYQ